MGKGILTIKILGDAGHFAKSLKKSNSLLAGLGKAALGAGALIGGAVVALGGIALKSAVTLDEAYDTIRVGTGATGKDLEGLKASFRTVFKGVPADAEAVGTAIADINTRTGQTGKGLEALTKQTVLLAKVTKTDVGELVAATTRVFGDWSIATDKQADAMDYLFKVSQNTGIGVDKLSQIVVQFGAPLRQLGFDFETSAAMMGKWEKEGVNLETVLAGMKFGLGKFAKEGLDAKEALIQVSDSIKQAGTLAEANKIAIEVFGKRAGPDMAAAIREGRFDLDALLATLEASPDTINKAAEATYDFGERWTMVKNKLMTLFEPLGIKLMDILEKLAAWVDAHMPEIEKTFSDVFAVMSGVAIYFKDEVIPPLIVKLGEFKQWLSDHRAEIEEFWNKVKTAAKGLHDFVVMMVPIVIEKVTDMYNDIKGPLENFKGLFDRLLVPVKEASALLGEGSSLAGAGKVIKAAWDVMWLPLSSMFKTFGAIAGVINDAIDALNRFNRTPVAHKDVVSHQTRVTGGSAHSGTVSQPRGITRAAGGPIPGSGPIPITAHGGEYVLTKGDTSLMKQLIANMGRQGGGDINIYVSGSGNPDAVAEKVYQKLRARRLSPVGVV